MFFSSLMETLFYLGLGIAFFLILFLVYLFKQRIINLERKNDTMFDILSTMIKEINCMRCNMFSGFNENITIEKEDIGTGIDFSSAEDNCGDEADEADAEEIDYEDAAEDVEVEVDENKKVVVEYSADNDDDYADDIINFAEYIDDEEKNVELLDDFKINEENANVNANANANDSVDSSSVAAEVPEIIDDSADFIDFGISGDDIKNEAYDTLDKMVDVVVAVTDVPTLTPTSIEIKTEEFDDEEGDGISVFSEYDKTGGVNLQNNINYKYKNLRVSALKKMVLNKFPDTDANKMKKGELIKILECSAE